MYDCGIRIASGKPRALYTVWVGKTIVNEGTDVISHHEIRSLGYSNSEVKHWFSRLGIYIPPLHILGKKESSHINSIHLYHVHEDAILSHLRSPSLKSFHWLQCWWYSMPWVAIYSCYAKDKKGEFLVWVFRRRLIWWLHSSVNYNLANIYAYSGNHWTMWTNNYR